MNEFNELKDKDQIDLLEQKLRLLQMTVRMAKVTKMQIPYQLELTRNEQVDYILQRIYAPRNEDTPIKYAILVGVKDSVKNPIILNFVASPPPPKEEDDDKDEGQTEKKRREGD